MTTNTRVFSWAEAVSGSFAEAGAWLLDGAPTQEVPGTGDDVVFATGSATPYTVTGDVSVASITITGDEVSFTGHLTASDTISWTADKIDLGTATLTVGAGAAFTAGSVLVIPPGLFVAAGGVPLLTDTAVPLTATAIDVTETSGGVTLTPVATVAGGTTPTTTTDPASTGTTTSTLTDNLATFGTLGLAIAGPLVQDTTTGLPDNTGAKSYDGPVSGLQDQYIDITPDNLVISATTDNWFIHSGAGTDAIAALGGTNVLDGGGGSNFLSGGGGFDTFFLDTRGASADIWDSINGFRAGDNVTIWGIDPSVPDLSWTDGQGAAGYSGVTTHIASAGSPTFSLTLVGYTAADLTNGRLLVTDGFDSASGSAYLSVHANS